MPVEGGRALLVAPLTLPCSEGAEIAKCETTADLFDTWHAKVPPTTSLGGGMPR
jgi:hypothetical protein